MPELHERFPLFPLGLVVLPHETVPLHIFEERYKTMISTCLEEEREFGIVWLGDEGLREVGCSAAISRVLDTLEDGRLNILVEGSQPFRLVRRIDDLPYPAGDIELLDEEPDGFVDTSVAEEARERYADLVARVTDQRPDEADLAGLDAYAMAATVDLALEAKQDLLEIRSEEERLRRVADLFATTMKRLDYAEQTGEIAKSNGRVKL
jgi:Lon protease-like protein